MKLPQLTSLLLCFVLLSNAVTALAFETDQYNLPPVPLADIGDEVSEYVHTALDKALAKINAEITESQQCLDQGPKKGADCSSVEKERGKLEHLRSNDAVAHELFKEIGDGSLLITKFGKWIKDHKFRAHPSSYKADYSESIFVAAPLDYATISPTVRLYGTEFGTDKLEHFFQQGYQYYHILRKAEKAGAATGKALKKAIAWGQRTERTYFGLLVSGVYSNADLYANYAGMRFYEGLTKPLLISDKSRPASVTLDKGYWKINDDSLRRDLIAPFLTDHMNEALNASAFAFHIYPSVRRIVKRSACPAWRERYPDLTKLEMAELSKSLEKWNGEDYGFTRKKRLVTLAEVCFSNESTIKDN